MVNFFPKRLSRNQSRNQFIYVNTWDGVAPIIRAKGMTIKAYHGLLYLLLFFNKQLLHPLNLH